jgi:Putative Ig domain
VKLCCWFAAACLGLVPLGADTTAHASTRPHVTVIGDSIMTGVLWHAKPMAILGQGIDLLMEVGVCRRIEGVSCPFEGAEVPTLVDLVPQLQPDIGKIVIVEMGYNEPAGDFAQEIDDTMQVLFQVGVSRVLWVNMREAEGQYPAMNAELLAAARRYPQLTVIDWNTYAAGHPEWFQNDGLHLLESGGEGLATVLHDALERLVLRPASPQGLFPGPPVLTGTDLPSARVGHRYSDQLVASRGMTPYRWQVTSGPLPPGLHLLADGTLSGAPRRAGRFPLAFRVTDALGQVATEHARLVIAANPDLP